MTPASATRKLTIVAKDPGLRIGGPDGPMAVTQVDVPAEILGRGPTGYRVAVVDYNATERVAYADQQDYQRADGELIDPFAPPPGESADSAAYQARLLGNPNFHAQNAYAIAMRTLGRFEKALGRRVGWSFGGHQLHIAPHAFAQANAFYSEPDRALLFGYFTDAAGSPVFTALSHDIIAHETTHAVLDGLRTQFSEPSTPDQAGFHEGFADVVALLSIFALEPVVAAAIGKTGEYARDEQKIALVDAAKLTREEICRSILLGMARQIGSALENGERDALRRSVELAPADVDAASTEEHDRGEVIVAAVMNAFIDLWLGRIAELGSFKGGYNLKAVVGEGAKLADQILTMCIRALDYCPPTDMDFGQFLAALLTADRELVPDDSRFGYRQALRQAFAAYGIVPPPECDAEGCWPGFADQAGLVYARSNFSALTRDPNELFRFLWENRNALSLSERAYTEVLTIDSATRAGPDGILMTETICQYYQRAELFAAECQAVLGTQRPAGMSSRTRLTAYGGGVLILDQYGQVKYHIANRLSGGERQQRRLTHLYESGQLDRQASRDRLRFALCHQNRMGA